MSMPQPGDKAPDFEAPVFGADSETLSLKDLRGKWVVLYFYPKDNTPGCTREAVGFTETIDEIRKLGAEVVGVSKDSIRSHQNFASKYNLRFPLLSDPDAEIAKAYGVWVKKKRYGKEYMGVQRSTFLIDPQGKIAKVWEKVNPDGHAEEVIQALRELTRG